MLTHKWRYSLGFSFWKRDASPISARIEFGCLGLAGTLWMALGAFMISSEAGVADVECYASEAEQVVIEVPGCKSIVKKKHSGKISWLTSVCSLNGNLPRSVSRNGGIRAL